MAGSVTTIEDGTPFVTLGIDREVFAVPVAAVLEILDMQSVCRIPDAPAYLIGLISVRERGVPVIDLRVRLGLPAVPATGHTRILVLDMPLAERKLTLGLVVDRVFEVTPLDSRSIEPPPDIGIRWRSDYIDGVGRRGDKFVIILNLARLFSSSDVPLAGTGVDGEKGAALFSAAAVSSRTTEAVSCA
ncbi:MAG: chemotaxis protein CheW [Azospirillaceae bacterium]|nr:chemotaxis protein CheW [Azospirillaceae bacterium]